MVRFEPVAGGASKVASFSNLKPDGTFSLATADGRPGALPGNYKVTLKIWKTYRPPHVSVVADKYVRQESSTLDAAVTEAGPNSFDFVVDPK